MADESDFKVIDQAPVFRRLSPDERRRLCEAMETRHYLAESVIWRYGDLDARKERGLHLVVAGEVSLALHGSRGATPMVRTLGPGAVFGEASLVTERYHPIGARSLSQTTILLLTRARYESLVTEMPMLRTILEDLHMLRDLEAEMVSALRRSALFRYLSVRNLSELCEAAELTMASVGEVVVRQGEEPHGFFFVISGELRVTITPGGSGSDALPVLVDTLHAGDIFGDVALVTAQPQPTTVTAYAPTRLVRVRAEHYRRLLDLSQSFRRGVRGAAADQTDALGAVAQAAAMALPGTVPFKPETRMFVTSVKAPITTLVRLVARALASTHNDQVLVVTFPEPAPNGNGNGPNGSYHPPEMHTDEGVTWIDLAVGDAHARARVGEVLDRESPRFNYVLLHAPGRSESFYEAIASFVDRVVYLTVDTYDPLPTKSLAHLPTLYATLLGYPRARRVTTLPLLHSGTVRLRVDLEALAKRSPTRLSELRPYERESVQRLARGVSDRRVGVALGGGGSWGYAHVTLLRGMRAANIPIDIVAGCSFGSLVGAYYCARGDEGLNLLMQRGPAITTMVLKAMFSSEAIADMVDDDLGYRNLEDLEVAFLPVATDVAMGTQRAIMSGTVGRGVRASGSFPGIFGPTTSRGYRLVDGGIINNVPEDAVVSEGAQLVVASNVVSQPTPLKAVPQPIFPGRVGRVLHELNPIERTSDLLRSMLILMHSAGSRDAHLADVTYNAEPVPHLPSDFLHSEAIATCAKPAVGHAIEQIRLRWHRLSQHLPDEYPAASLAPPAPSSWSPDKADPYNKPFPSLST